MSKPDFEGIVVDKGFVYVGRPTIQDGWILIEDGLCLRKWGGDRQGLGYTLLHGKTTDRDHFEISTVHKVPMHSLVSFHRCNQEVWEKEFQRVTNEGS